MAGDGRGALVRYNPTDGAVPIRPLLRARLPWYRPRAGRVNRPTTQRGGSASALKDAGRLAPPPVPTISLQRTAIDLKGERVLVQHAQAEAWAGSGPAAQATAGPQASSGLQATPGPQATAAPQATGPAPQATSTPQATPAPTPAPLDPPAPRHPPLLLLHGMASSWRQWRRTLLRLAGEVPAIALDFPGFGGSDRPHRPMTARDYADACEAWCRARDLPPLAAVGHSFGGAVLVDWASRYPERFRSLGLLAPAAVYHPWHSAGGGPIRWPVVGPLLVPLFIWIVSTEAVGRRAFAHIVRDMSQMRREDVADLQWGCRRAREMLRALDYYRFPDLEAALRRIHQPVVLGWGTHDRVVPYSDVPVFERNLPNVRLVTWHDCGHVPMMERPEACDALLREVWRAGRE